MRDEQHAVESFGAQLVVVGCGQPFQAAAFRDEQGIDFPLLVDPELRAYAAAGLRRGLRALIGRQTLAYVWRALSAGHRQGRVRGDPWQSGGMFVIEPPGVTRYAYVSQVPGDHAPTKEVLDVLRRLKDAA